jgi:hypothetical protein
MAETERSRISPISLYERPSSSRMTSAERWLKLKAPRACLISSTVGMDSSMGGAETRSSQTTSLGRRASIRKRWRHSLCAIFSSQLRGSSGRSPRWNAR